MKLQTEIKSGLNQRKSSNCFLFLFLCLIFIFHFSVSFAQSSSFTFNQTNLSDALVQVSQTMNFKLAFDSKALAKHQVSGTYKANTPDEILVILLKNTGYVAEKRFGNYLIIPAPPEKLVTNRSFCRVSGLITDQVSGEQLPHAGIFLPGQNLFLSSSTNGTFAFRIPATKSIQIRIQYIGYQPVDSMLFLSDTTAVFTFRMKQKNMELAPFQVRKTRLKMIDQNKEAGQSSINAVGFVNLPNMGESDIFRIIQLLPGVGYAEGSSGLNILPTRIWSFSTVLPCITSTIFLELFHRSIPMLSRTSRFIKVDLIRATVSGFQELLTLPVKQETNLIPGFTVGLI